MNALLALALLGAPWEPPPAAVAKALEVAPASCVYTHGHVAGLLATRDGRRPAMGFFF